MPIKLPGECGLGGASESKDSGRQKHGEPPGFDPYAASHAGPWPATMATVSAESRDLGKGEVHKMKPTLDHMGTPK